MLVGQLRVRNSVFWLNFSLGQALSPRGVTFTRVPGPNADVMSLALLLPFYQRLSCFLFFCLLPLATMIGHQCPWTMVFLALSCCRLRLLFPGEGEVDKSGGALTVAAIPSLSQYLEEEFSGSFPICPMSTWWNSWKNTCKLIWNTPMSAVPRDVPVLSFSKLWTISSWIFLRVYVPSHDICTGKQMIRPYFFLQTSISPDFRLVVCPTNSAIRWAQEKQLIFSVSGFFSFVRVGATLFPAIYNSELSYWYVWSVFLQLLPICVQDLVQ